MHKIVMLVVTPREPHPKCRHPQMALRGTGRHGGGEVIARHAGPCSEVAFNSGIAGSRRHIAPRILHQ